MAKDGTRRGGARIGAGRKPKPLDDKILEGKIIPLEVINPKDEFEIPQPKEYISAEQKDGYKTYAEKIYNATYQWLKSCGCAEIITPQLVENYSQTIGRHIQAEELLTKEGLLTGHPTTGMPIASPYVRMSLDYLKSANQLWYQIYQLVKENGVRDGGINSADGMMENILGLVK